MTILLYSGEYCVISHDMDKINDFTSSCYRIMFNINVKNIKHQDIFHDKHQLIHHVRNRQLRFLGHILRLQEDGGDGRPLL